MSVVSSSISRELLLFLLLCLRSSFIHHQFVSVTSERKKRQENGGNGKNWKGREKKGEIKIWGILNFKKKSVPSFAGSGTKLSWVLTARESESGKEGSVV